MRLVRGSVLLFEGIIFPANAQNVNFDTYNDMENICSLNVHKFKISTTTITIDKVESRLTTNKKRNKKKNEAAEWNSPKFYQPVVLCPREIVCCVCVRRRVRRFDCSQNSTKSTKD